MRYVVGVLAAVLLSLGAWGQGAASPSQPLDPTAQAPATPPESTPPTFPKSDTQAEQSPKAEDHQSSAHAEPFTGTVVRRGDAYVLRAGDSEYGLVGSLASKYEGQKVRVLGILSKEDNSIRLQTIKKAPKN